MEDDAAVALQLSYEILELLMHAEEWYIATAFNVAALDQHKCHEDEHCTRQKDLYARETRTKKSESCKASKNPNKPRNSASGASRFHRQQRATYANVNNQQIKLSSVF